MAVARHRARAAFVRALHLRRHPLAPKQTQQKQERHCWRARDTSYSLLALNAGNTYLSIGQSGGGTLRSCWRTTKRRGHMRRGRRFRSEEVLHGNFICCCFLCHHILPFIVLLLGITVIAHGAMEAALVLLLPTAAAFALESGRVTTEKQARISSKCWRTMSKCNGLRRFSALRLLGHDRRPSFASSPRACALRSYEENSGISSALWPASRRLGPPPCDSSEPHQAHARHVAWPVAIRLAAEKCAACWCPARKAAKHKDKQWQHSHQRFMVCTQYVAHGMAVGCVCADLD